MAVSTVAPDAAAALADRYYRSGGNREVYGIQQAAGPDGLPVVTVWTHDPDPDGGKFEVLKAGIVRFLEDADVIRAGKGYQLDVFGPDGSLQHRLDARP